ncbi:MAG: helix-turn-helix domain-containing protein [Alteromonadaceae bacterium]|nr:helix-turn-helix domain-containing protein [Alteromonadaceae bacterium]
MMNNVAHISQALPGAGKTQAFIDHVADGELERGIVLALPTLKLVNDVHERLWGAGVDTIKITSETGSGTSHAVEMVLDDRREDDPLVLVVTHACLRLIDPMCLVGWNLVIDEVPDISNTGSLTIWKATFETFCEPYIDIDEGGLTTLKAGNKALFEKVSEEHSKDKFIVAASVFNALVDSDVDVYVKYQKAKGNYRMGCVGFHDYVECFRCADESHLLGHAVERSLLYLHLEASGFEFKESRYQPEFQSYKMSPTLVPLYKGDRFSKTVLLTNDKGEAKTTWESDVSGEKVIDNAMGHNGTASILTQVHSWCEYDFSDEHMIQTGFDARGLNTFTGVNRTLNLIHGNSSGIEDGLNSMMLGRMGIDEKRGKAAIHYSRCLEMMIQHICRTSIRTFEAQTVPTVHYVPNESMAEQIAEALKIDCEIDRSIMIDPPKRVTEAKANREAKKSQAKALLAEGKQKKEIAEFLGVTPRTITNWLKAS